MVGDDDDEATCWICYDGESAGHLLRSGCACHGACGSVHLRCLVSAADASAYKEDDDFWVACPTCKEMRSGPTQLGLARVRWGLVKSRPDWDYARQSACTEIAVAYIESGDFATSEKLREELLAVDRRIRGDEHPQTVSSLVNYGKILSMRCQYSKARDIIESALRTAEESTLCQALEAEARLEAGADRDGKLCPDGSLMAAIKMELGSIYLELAEHDKAQQHFEEALELERHVLPAENTWTICARNYLGEALRRKGEFEKARALLQGTRDAFCRAMGAEHPETIGALADVGQVNLNMKNYDVADESLKQGLEQSMRILGKTHSLTLTFMSLLGELRLEQRKLDAAVGYLVPALEAQRKVLSRRCPVHVAVLNTLSRLGRARTAMGGVKSSTQAIEALQECLTGRLGLFGHDHPKVNAARTELKAAEDVKTTAITTSNMQAQDQQVLAREADTTQVSGAVEEDLLQQWLDCKQDDSVTKKLDLEVAELIEELQPKYPAYTWRDHLFFWANVNHCRFSDMDCLLRGMALEIIVGVVYRFYWFIEKLEYLEDEHPYCLTFFVGIILAFVVYMAFAACTVVLLDYILLPACDGTMWVVKAVNDRSMSARVAQLLVSVGVPESRVPDILMAGSPASSTSTFLKSLSIPDSLMQELRAHRDVAPQGELDITDLSCEDVVLVLSRRIPTWVSTAGGYLRAGLVGAISASLTVCYFFELVALDEIANEEL